MKLTSTIRNSAKAGLVALAAGSMGGCGMAMSASAPYQPNPRLAYTQAVLGPQVTAWEIEAARQRREQENNANSVNNGGNFNQKDLEYRSEVQEVVIDYNAQENGQTGMGIRTRIAVWNGFGRTIKASTYFEIASGDKKIGDVPAVSTRYSSQDGHLATSGEEFTIGRSFQSYVDYKMFVPDSEFSGLPRNESTGVDVRVVLFDVTNREKQIPISEGKKIRFIIKR